MAKWRGECPVCGKMVSRVSVVDWAVKDPSSICPVMCDACAKARPAFAGESDAARESKAGRGAGEFGMDV